jgi:hypothetical protein
MFPDVATRGTVSRPELLDVMKALKTEKYPLWLMKDKVGRGLYAVAGGGDGHTPAVVIGNKKSQAKRDQIESMEEISYNNKIIPLKTDKLK